MNGYFWLKQCFSSLGQPGQAGLAGLNAILLGQQNNPPFRMVRSELIAAISEKNPHFSQPEVELSVKAILGEMAQHLSRGGRIEFRGFGSFSITIHPPRIGLNPRTGVKVPVPEKRVVHFKASKELRARVDVALT